MSDLPRIASLWIGGRLSWLEQLCLISFADAGHETTLYSYEPIPNVPEGVKNESAEEIFPAEPMLRHKRTGSPAIHADFFRLHLLAKTDQIWVDADMYCKEPFDYEDPHVFGWEKPEVICNAVLGLPKDSPALKMALEFFEDEYAIAPWLRPWQQKELQAERDAGRPVHITEQNWGFTGPAAITWFLHKSGEISHALPQTAFYAVPFKNRNKFFTRRGAPQDYFDEDTKGVHFWARRLKPRLEEKEDNRPHEGSYLEGLLTKHGINPDDAPIPARAQPTDERRNDAAFCAEIGIEALQGESSIDNLARRHLLDKAFIKQCRDTIVEGAPRLFRHLD